MFCDWEMALEILGLKDEALFSLCLKSDAAAVRELLGLGTDPNREDPRTGQTCLRIGRLGENWNKKLKIYLSENQTFSYEN